MRALFALALVAPVVLGCSGAGDAATEPVVRARVPGIDLGVLGDFAVRASSVPAYAEHRVEDLVAGRSGETVRVRVVHDLPAGEAERMRRHEWLLLDGLYEVRLPPYPEFLTRRTGCEERFRPVVRDLPGGAFAVTFADAHFDYGVCADDLVRYSALYALVHCVADRRLYRVEYFTDRTAAPAALEALARSFHCTGASSPAKR